MFNRILVAVDPTHAEEGPRALATAAAQLAGDGELRLLTVISGEDTAFFPAFPDLSFDENEAQARQLLEKLATQHLPPDCRHESAVLHGVTTDVILDDARSWGADLLVLVAHGETGNWSLRRDTVQQLGAQPPCALLILPQA